MLQAVLSRIYPSQCPGCSARVAEDHALCPDCWTEVPFIHGCFCGQCGMQLPGDQPDGLARCDDCLRNPPPWTQGRAAMMYRGKARKMVLALKHGDRLDLVKPLAKWMAGPAREILTPDTLLIPVPLHWRRLLKRRYNQAALLAKALGQECQCDMLVDGLNRVQATPSLDGKTRDERFATILSAIAINPKRKAKIAGRRVILVDDVMTSGATLTACTQACQANGAADTAVLTLARVGKAP